MSLSPMTTESSDLDTFHRPTWQRWLLQAVLPLFILLGAIALLVWLLKTAPRSKRRKRGRRSAVLVNTMPVKSVRERVVVEAMGTVIPAREVRMFPEVKGRVVNISKELIVGGLFRRGKFMLRVDPRDYRYILLQRKSEYARALANLKIEMGRQSIALREYKLLGKTIPKANRDLVLRKPQLMVAKASIQNAKAALSKAKTDLRRTVISSPFNAVVTNHSVSLGSRVSENTELLRLVGTTFFGFHYRSQSANCVGSKHQKMRKKRERLSGCTTQTFGVRICIEQAE